MSTRLEPYVVTFACRNGSANERSDVSGGCPPRRPNPNNHHPKYENYQPKRRSPTVHATQPATQPKINARRPSHGSKHSAMPVPDENAVPSFNAAMLMVFTSS